MLIIGNVTFNFRSFPKRYTTSISDKIEYRLYSLKCKYQHEKYYNVIIQYPKAFKVRIH